MPIVYRLLVGNITFTSAEEVMFLSDVCLDFLLFCFCVSVCLFVSNFT